jgi:hypothetical protein
MALGAGITLAACSSSPDAANTSSTTTTVATTTSTISTTSSTTSTTGTSSQAANQTVTADVRSQLVAAGAAVNNIPVTQYSGLTAGLTYYAVDRATGTYWAAAQLVPASTNPNTPPTQAQIASQDDGSYYLFTRPAGKGWTAHADGQTGPDTPCPITVPADVVQLWGWPAGSCRPAST